MLVLSSLVFCAGCEGPGFLAYVIAGPPKVDAQFVLDKRPTLVVVDDPNLLLGDPSYPAVVGANVGFNLIQNKALPESMVVSQDRLTTLAKELGNRYGVTPIDQVGKTLGAEQVIYVFIRTVSVQVDNTYYHPTASVEVKVIDVPTGGRLFPVKASDPVNNATPPGYNLTVGLRKQTMDETRRTALTMLARSLAERIGLETAQLFYKHVPAETKPK